MPWAENFRNRISTSHPELHCRDLSLRVACYDGGIGARIPTRPIRVSYEHSLPKGSIASSCLPIEGLHWARLPIGKRWSVSLANIDSRTVVGGTAERIEVLDEDSKTRTWKRW